MQIMNISVFAKEVFFTDPMMSAPDYNFGCSITIAVRVIFTSVLSIVAQLGAEIKVVFLQ